MPGGSQRDIPLRAWHVESELNMAVQTDPDETPIDVTLDDGELTIDLKLGHGPIECVLYGDQDDRFAGLCDGPMGEIPVALIPVHGE